MKKLHLSAAVLLVLSSAWVLWAEIPPPEDDVSAAYAAALADFLAGKNSTKTAEQLQEIIEKNSDSPYFKLAHEFQVDLAESARHPPPAQGTPAQRLAESRLDYHLLVMPDNWGKSLQQAMEKNPDDPAVQLLSKDRTVIGELLPLLQDRSPTRVRRDHSVSGFPPPQPRVCDLALAITQFHSKCLFARDSRNGQALHQWPDDMRQKIIERVGQWWQENKDKSVAEGIRAQLPHADFYPDKVWMATTLVRLGREQKTDDDQFGLNVLHEMVQQYRRSHVGAYTADALATLGDTSAVDVFYQEWKNEPRIEHDPHIAFYLCQHGRRREWEMLLALSQEEMAAGRGPSQGAVWSCVVNSGVANKNPYAIPILGLVLTQVDETGSRWIDERVGAQSFSYADMAIEYLQKQVHPVHFGYQRSGSATERAAAIRKAQQWWDDEGKLQYNFDYIEENLIDPHPAPPK